MGQHTRRRSRRIFCENETAVIIMKKNELIWSLKALPVAIKDWWILHFCPASSRYASLKELKNSHKGERCFFIGTGPSLDVKDVEQLAGEQVFIFNYGITLCDKISYKPDYYLIVDPTCYRDVEQYIDTDKVKNSIVVDMVDFAGGITNIKNDEEWIHLPGYRAFFYLQRALGTKWSFSNRIDKGVFSGGSIVYFCYQLAVYMGFDEIYLLGMDCDYSKDKVHFISVNNETDKKLRDNAGWYNNTFLKMHSCAAYYCKKYNVSVYNLTPGGKLEVFQRKTLEGVLSSGKRNIK